MPVVNTKSTVITNRDAVPRVASNANIFNCQLQEAVGVVEAANNDSIGSKYFFATIPSNARVSRILLSCDAISTSGAMDVGLYQTTDNGGAVVEVDTFASAVVLTSALVHSDITHESDPTGSGATNYGIEDQEKMVWQLLGLSSDPNRSYDVVGTVTTATGGAGTIALKIQYVA
mgnify:CR=1 FL=1